MWKALLRYYYSYNYCSYYYHYSCFHFGKQPTKQQIIVNWWVSSIRLAARPRSNLSNQIKASKQCKSKDTKAHPQTTCTKRASLPEPRDFADASSSSWGSLSHVVTRPACAIVTCAQCTIKHFKIFKSRSLFMS